MATPSQVLNQLLSFESMRDYNAAIDYVLELPDSDLDAASSAIGQLLVRGTPGQMRFASQLFQPFQQPRGRLRAADLVAAARRPDRPQAADFEINLASALLEELARTRDANAIAELRDVHLPGDTAGYLAALFLLVDPKTFWARLDEWKTAERFLSKLPLVDAATVATIEAELSAHRDRFTDKTWTEIEDNLAWRRKRFAAAQAK